jgi:hypothetical protein
LSVRTDVEVEKEDDMNKYTFCVITKIPKPWLGEDGNLCSASFAMLPDYPDSDLYIKDITYGGGKEVTEKTYKPHSITQDEMNKILPNHDFDFMVENFTLGEICILDEPLGREVSGKQRAPRKWLIDFEEFKSLEKAVKRSQEVLRRDELIHNKGWYLGDGAEFATTRERRWLESQEEVKYHE